MQNIIFKGVRVVRRHARERAFDKFEHVAPVLSVKHGIYAALQQARAGSRRQRRLGVEVDGNAEVGKNLVHHADIFRPVAAHHGKLAVTPALVRDRALYLPRDPPYLALRRRRAKKEHAPVRSEFFAAVTEQICAQHGKIAFQQAALAHFRLDPRFTRRLRKTGERTQRVYPGVGRAAVGGKAHGEREAVLRQGAHDVLFDGGESREVGDIDVRVSPAPLFYPFEQHFEL